MCSINYTTTNYYCILYELLYSIHLLLIQSLCQIFFFLFLNR